MNNRVEMSSWPLANFQPFCSFVRSKLTLLDIMPRQYFLVIAAGITIILGSPNRNAQPKFNLIVLAY